MRLAVVGASGRSGRSLLRLAQQRGHVVEAIVRDAARLGDSRPDAVSVLPELEGGALTPPIGRSDAVAFCIGPVPGESVAVQQEAIVPVLDAMGRTGTRRLVAISASGGVVDGDDPLNRYIAKPILARVLKAANADMAEVERRIRASGTEWTIVRPPKLTGRRGTGRYRARRDGNVRWGYTISRDDLALSILDAVDDPTSIHQTVSVAG